MIIKRPLRTAIVYDPVFQRHKTGLGHPESPERCDAVISALRGGKFKNRIFELKPREAAEAEILLCHTPGYLEVVRADIVSGRRMLSTGDTPIGPDSLKAALHAAGAGLTAVDAVVEGEAANAFCPVRPPGHHATADRGMGFCIFNNVAIAAEYARREHGINRVLILDWDVHHGNGTQDIFYDDRETFFLSIHQSPCYPGTGGAGETGRGPGAGFTLNIPLPAGTPGEKMAEVFNKNALSVASDFKPGFVMISAGFDSHRSDPLGQLLATDEDFAKMTRAAMEIADTYAKGRLVSFMEGGYDLKALPDAAVAHVRTLSPHIS